MKKFPWLLYLCVLCLIGLVAMAPIGSVMVASLVANANGCRVDEGSVHPCMVGGKDYGEMLYTLGVLGWLMLITLPLGALAGLLWLVVLLLHRAKWKKQQTVARVT